MLNKNARELQYLLAKRVNLRRTPKLRFVYDESIIYGDRMVRLIDDVVKKDEARKR